MRGRFDLPVMLFAALFLAACSGSSGTAVTTEPATEPVTEPVTEPATESERDSESDEQAGTPPTVTESTAPTSEPAPPTTAARPSLSVVSVDPDTGEVSTIEVENLGPATYTEVVDAGIEAGLWDELDGLSRVLGFLVGAVDADQVPGVAEVEIGEFGDILNRANALALSDVYTETELAELRSRYEVFAPSAETLDQIAASSGAEEGSAAGGFRSPAAACAPVDPDDFDDNIWVTGCYRMIEQTLSDARLRVFYPDWYEADGNLASIPPATLAALVKSIETYRNLGTVGDVDLLFSAVDTVPLAAYATAGATAQWASETVVGCPVSVFPLAIRHGLEQFEQIIAHEVWHCVQHYDGFPTTLRSGTAWYREAGAHYFSNVVYPSANFEHHSLVRFDGGLETSLFDMSYEAWIFWQHMGNENGARFVADLNIDLMNAGTSQPQLMRPFEEQFHDFTIDYVAGVILDQDGAALPKATRFHVLDSVDKNAAGTSVTLELGPLTATRWHVSYDQELRILQTDASRNSLNSMVKFAERTDRPAWSAILPEVRSSCRAPAKYAGVTTSPTMLHDVKITIDTVEEASCDPCLLGTWSMNLDTFEQMILGGIANQGGLPAGTTFEIGGDYYFAFNEDSVVLEQRDGLAVIATVAGLGSITTTINSFASGEYEADGERLTMSNLAESYNEVTTNIPFGGGAQSFPSVLEQGAGSYECNTNSLQLTADGFDTVTFSRVDRILTPQDSPADAD